MTLIESALARKILDSRGNPTVEVEILTDSGYGTAAAPSGASTGEHEVQSFPKEGGVDTSLKAFSDDVLPQILGMDAAEQREMDSDDPNKQNLSKCIELADYTFMNNGSIKDLIEQVRIAMLEIKTSVANGKRKE